VLVIFSSGSFSEDNVGGQPLPF